MKQKRTPTLAELRKLAKKKGYETFKVSDSGHEMSARGIGDPPNINLLAWRDRLAEARCVLFAALSALPDAPAGGAAVSAPDRCVACPKCRKCLKCFHRPYGNCPPPKPSKKGTR